MRGSRAKLVGVSLAVAVLLGGLTPALQAGQTADSRSPAVCGPKDTPETGIQGDVPKADQQDGRAEQGYNCGLAVVGHNDLGGDPSSSLAWSGNCAYVQSRGARVVHVIDVSDPTAPRLATDLPTGGASENLHAVTNAQRAILVAARGAGAGENVNNVDVYDVRQCTAPVHLGAIKFPIAPIPNPAGPVHNVELDPSATHVYGSIPLQQADITNLADPSTWTVRNFQCEIFAQVFSQGATNSPGPANPCDVTTIPPAMAHEFEFNSSGTRMYIGGQQDFQLYDQDLKVLDMTTWPPKVISITPGPGHGIRRATIGGKPFLLNSDETAPPTTVANAVLSPASRVLGTGIPRAPAVDNAFANGCIPEAATPFAGTAQSLLTDISDEKAPVTKSQLRLAINDPANCAAQVDSQVNSTVHYNTVDDPDHTTFAMLSMKNAGLRVWDVRNPSSPAEVAYFNPGQYRTDDGSTTLDRTRMHTYYQTSTGTIWLLSESGGFWVLELEPRVRTALGLPARHANNRDGRPARSADLSSPATVVAVKPLSAPLGALSYYCRW